MSTYAFRNLCRADGARGMARQLIDAVATGALREALIPPTNRVTDRWIRRACYRQHVSCRQIGGLYLVRKGT